MGLRFQKRIKIFNGLNLNISKTGISWTLGKPGASINIRDDKATGSVGIPGTGISYRQRLAGQRSVGTLSKLLPWLVIALVIANTYGRDIAALLGWKLG